MTQGKTKVHTVYKNKEGKRICGVTTILRVLDKPALLNWAWQCGIDGIDYKKERDNKADIGTLAHHLILCDLKGDTPDVSDYSPNDVKLAGNCLASFYEWKKTHPIKPVLLEEPLISEKYQYGGTVDCVGLLGTDLTLIDFKTSPAIYSDNFYQLAAYRQALHENHQFVDDVRVVRVGRDEDEDFEEKIITDTAPHFEVFKHCLEIYELQKQLRRKK